MSNISDKRFAIFGVGNIGRILLNRLLASGSPAENLAICDKDIVRASAVAGQFGVRPISLCDESVRTADAILVAAPLKCHSRPVVEDR